MAIRHEQRWSAVKQLQKKENAEIKVNFILWLNVYCSFLIILKYQHFFHLYHTYNIYLFVCVHQKSLYPYPINRDLKKCLARSTNFDLKVNISWNFYIRLHVYTKFLCNTSLLGYFLSQKCIPITSKHQRLNGKCFAEHNVCKKSHSKSLFSVLTYFATKLKFAKFQFFSVTR